MGKINLLLAGAIFLIIIFEIFKKQSFLSESEEFGPYKRKDFLMNVPERKFFEELQKLIPANCVVFPQVVLGSIVYADTPKNEAYRHRNKINRKTIDFVIFEKPYYKPVVAIEYDGRTHNYQSRMQRDAAVDRILESSGIKIFHVKHQENINFEEIKNKINEFFVNKNS